MFRAMGNCNQKRKLTIEQASKERDIPVMTKFPSKDRFQFDEPLWKVWTKLPTVLETRYDNDVEKSML
jgi:hypothetical protein